jgi:hypothetical protein
MQKDSTRTSLAGFSSASEVRAVSPSRSDAEGMGMRPGGQVKALSGPVNATESVVTKTVSTSER